MSGISIGPNINDDGGYALLVFADMEDINPATGTADFCRKVIMINSGAGTDEHTGEEQTGIMIRGLGTVADGPGSDILQISPNGIIATGGVGYQIGRILGGTVSASGVFAPIANISDTNIILAGIYARALNAGTSKSYAAFFDGPIFIQGKAIAEGFALSKDNVYHPSNVATQTLPANYNLFINNLSFQNQQWNLPDPAAYEPWEEIEIVNCNDFDISIRVLPGDYLNTSAYDAKRLALDFSGACAKLRSDGINHWYIVSLQGGIGN